MKDWSKPDRFWQCDACLNLITYDHICQPPGASTILCRECYSTVRGVFGSPPAVPPILCDSCGNGMLPLENVQNAFIKDERNCVDCTRMLSDGDIDDAIDGLLGILEDNE